MGGSDFNIAIPVVVEQSGFVAVAEEDEVGVAVVVIVTGLGNSPTSSRSRVKKESASVTWYDSVAGIERTITLLYLIC